MFLETNKLFSQSWLWGVLDLLNFLPVHVRRDWCSHRITMVAFTPARWKTVKFQQIGHTPGSKIKT